MLMLAGIVALADAVQVCYRARANHSNGMKLSLLMLLLMCLVLLRLVGSTNVLY